MRSQDFVCGCALFLHRKSDYLFSVITLSCNTSYTATSSNLLSRLRGCTSPIQPILPNSNKNAWKKFSSPWGCTCTMGAVYLPHSVEAKQWMDNNGVCVCMYTGRVVSATRDSHGSGAHSWLSWHRHSRQAAYLFRLICCSVVLATVWPSAR